MKSYDTARRVGSRPGGRVHPALLALILVVVQAGTTGSIAWAQDDYDARSGDSRGDRSAGLATTAAGDFDYDSQSLRVGVWLDRDSDEVYERGQRMSAGFQVNQDAYAVVYHIDTDGVVAILWPRSRLDDGFVFGGNEYSLPVTGARPLTAGRNEGEGYIEAVVSRYPFDLRGLEIDFHHEAADEVFDFQVAGDPFLAMNEVNFAVTGLEDSGDYVVTNYANYYVHRKVDHPRYLCGQCHFDDDVVYDPYRDSCNLQITSDYGWGNRWYDHYGYYPVYANPVYVYVDPWTWRPWVNFWYSPYYSCAPAFGYSWYSDCWVWCDSPYYRGDIYVSYRDGHRRYRPLTPGDGGQVARKGREYGRVTPLVAADGPDARDRDAMESRSGSRPRNGPARGVDQPEIARRPAAPAFRGEPEAARSRPQIAGTSRDDSGTGLRIRRPASPGDGSSAAPGQVRTRSEYRHTAGSAEDRSSLTPVARPRTGEPGARPAPGVREATKVPEPGGRIITPVEPRKKGTRIWNSGSSSSADDRGGRSPQVNPARREPDRMERPPARQTEPRRDQTPAREPAKPKDRSGERKESERRSSSVEQSPARTGGPAADRSSSGRAAPGSRTEKSSRGGVREQGSHRR